MSREPVTPDPEIRALEAALESLTPARSAHHRDRIMFRAGQAAARAQAGRHRRLWMAVAATFAVVAAGEGAFIAGRSPSTVERIVVRQVPVLAPVVPPFEPIAIQPGVRPSEAADEPLPALGRTDYERLTGQVLRYGLDGLPAPPPAALAHSEPWPAPTRERLREEFRKALDSGDAS